jgi:hypothetical protein
MKKADVIIKVPWAHVIPQFVDECNALTWGRCKGNSAAIP